MKNNKGFVGMGLILAIIAVLVVGGGAYYLGTKNVFVPQVPVDNSQPAENQNNNPKLEVPTGPFGDETNYVPPKPISCNSNTTPWIQVLSPNGGENYVLGQTINIKWDSKCIGSNEKISVSIYKKGAQLSQEGSPYGYIITNTGSYNWIIPKDINPNQYEVSVGYILINGKAVYDDSDNLFTINSSISSITVLSPNGGEVYKNSDKIAVQWKGIVKDRVAIYLRFSSGEWCFVKDVPSSNTNYTFIPYGHDCGDGRGVISKWQQYKITLIAYKNGGMSPEPGTAFAGNYNDGDDASYSIDSSDNFFTIK